MSATRNGALKHRRDLMWLGLLFFSRSPKKWRDNTLPTPYLYSPRPIVPLRGEQKWTPASYSARWKHNTHKTYEDCSNRFSRLSTKFDVHSMSDTWILIKNELFFQTSHEIFQIQTTYQILLPGAIKTSLSSTKHHNRSGVRCADVSTTFKQDVRYLNICEKFSSRRYLVLQKSCGKCMKTLATN